MSIHVQRSCPTSLGFVPQYTPQVFRHLSMSRGLAQHHLGLCHNTHLRFSDIYPCLGFIPQYTPQVSRHLSMSRGLAQHTWVCATIHTLGFQTSIHVLGSYHNTHLRFPDIYPCLEVLPNTIQVCALIHHSGFLMPIHDHGFVPKYTFKVFKFPNTYPMPLINSL